MLNGCGSGSSKTLMLVLASLDCGGFAISHYPPASDVLVNPALPPRLACPDVTLTSAFRIGSANILASGDGRVLIPYGAAASAS